MRLSWRTRKTSRTSRQKRSTWQMRSAQVRFRRHYIGRRLTSCSLLYKELRFMTREDDGCVAGIGVAHREVPGSSGVRRKDKTSRHSKRPKRPRRARPQQLPLANLDSAFLKLGAIFMQVRGRVQLLFWILRTGVITLRDSGRQKVRTAFKKIIDTCLLTSN